jgi:hypothetical protein
MFPTEFRRPGPHAAAQGQSPPGLSANWRRLAQSFEAAEAWLAHDESDPLIGVPQQRLAGLLLN